MISIRKSDERGRTRTDWLLSLHTFSFADYFDPQHVEFRALRVINEDTVQPGTGFGPHPHRDMEILTYVLAGTVEHQDSMGHRTRVAAGEVQRMTAGTGVVHSEMNPSPTDALHLLQIWIHPERKGLKPEFEQRRITAHDTRGRLQLVASRDGREGALTIHQDVELHAGLLDSGQRVRYPLKPERYAWIQVARGAVDVNGHRVSAGDGAAARRVEELRIAAERPSEILLFDLA
ncbi:MAG: pirin family protein [Planctomycetes bacterium]|nr:pirin family protein [Planctomycetota bacterium]